MIVTVTLEVEVREHSWASYFGIDPDAYERAEVHPRRSLVADVRDYVRQAVAESPAGRDYALSSVTLVDDAEAVSS